MESKLPSANLSPTTDQNLMPLDTADQIVANCPGPPGPTQDVILNLPSAVLMMPFREETPSPQSDPPEEKSRVPTTPCPTASSEDLRFPPLCPNLANPRTTPTALHDFPVTLALQLIPPYLSHLRHLLTMSRSLNPIMTPRERRFHRSERLHPRSPPVSSVTRW